MKQEKLDRLLDLLEHPENYTEPQKDELLADAEVREIYRQMVATREALDYQKSKETMVMPLISEEWERLRKVKSEERRVKSEVSNGCSNDDRMLSEWRSKTISLWSPMRKVAAVAAVLVVSGITFAAIHLATHGHQEDAENPVKTMVAQKDSDKQVSAVANDVPVEKTDSASQQFPLVYENAELQAILASIAQHYHLKVVYQTEASRHIRLYLQLTEGMSLDDIIELMNHFEKVNIRHEGESLIVE